MGPSQVIIDTIGQFVKKMHIDKVYIADNKTQPPLFGYVLSFPRLVLPVQGHYETEIEKGGKTGTVRVKPGEAIFAGPNGWDKPSWAKPVKVFSFLFGPRHTGISLVWTDGRSDANINAEKMALAGPITGPAERIIQALLDLRKRADFPAYPQLVEALVYCLRDTILEGGGTRQGRSESLFQNICSYLMEHFQHDITRDFVAGQFGITPNHLSRLFRSNGNTHFNDYLNHVRIEHAKFLLHQYDMTLQQISRSAGFSEIGYFCRVFKKFTGKTPTTFRHEQVKPVHR